MKPKDEIVHNGLAPARRPPDDEPERVGEGELGKGPSAGELDSTDEGHAEKTPSLDPTQTEGEASRIETSVPSNRSKSPRAGPAHSSETGIEDLGHPAPPAEDVD